MNHSRKRDIRPYCWLIRAIGVIVPRRLRADWRQEWEAELRYRETLLADWERLNWRTKLGLLWRSLGAFWDALWLQQLRWEDEMLQDLRYGFRILLKNPGFSAVAVLTLALGIGANTAIFSVVNAVLLRPLPYVESERLVLLSERSQQIEKIFVAWPNYLDWRAQNRVFEHIGLYNRDSYNLTGGGEPERLLAGQVSADLFAALRVGAALGRLFTRDEDQPGAPPVVVLSHGLWQRRFGGDPNILDRTITLNDRSYTVIGVLPAGFQFPSRVELWVPAGQLSGRDWQQRGNHPGLYGVARLKPGVTIEQARAEMDAIALGLEKQYPDTNRDHRVSLTPLMETVVGDVRWAMWVLLAAASFVLAVACANVANLLLVGAGLLLRSFYRLNQVNPGFAYDYRLSFSLSLPESKYGAPEQRTDFYRRLTQKLRGLPGVQSVGLASGLPFGNSSWRTSFVIEGRPNPPPGELPLLEACLVSPDYFRTLGIPLRAGRYFIEQDNRQHLAGRNLSGREEGAKLVAGLNAVIIDEEFARRYWPNENAVGQHIRLGPVDPGSPLLTVVGVVGRVKMDRLSMESNRVQGYFSCWQFPFSNMTVVIKSALEPTQIIAAARQQVQALDPHQPIYNLRTLEQVRADSIAPERLNLTLLSLFGALALVLGAVGIYGVMSYAVTQRTHEIGVRLALGARTGDVLKLVVRQGITLALIGVTLGLVASFVLTRWMKTLLFGISTTDPLTFSMIALLLTLVALLACYLPARRASRVDPMVALRHE